MRLNSVESNANGDRVRSAHFSHGIDSSGRRRGVGGRRGMLSLFMHMYVLTHTCNYISVYVLFTRK